MKFSVVFLTTTMLGCIPSLQGFDYLGCATNNDWCGTTPEGDRQYQVAPDCGDLEGCFEDCAGVFECNFECYQDKTWCTTKVDLAELKEYTCVNDCDFDDDDRRRKFDAIVQSVQAQRESLLTKMKVRLSSGNGLRAPEESCDTIRCGTSPQGEQGYMINLEECGDYENCIEDDPGDDNCIDRYNWCADPLDLQKYPLIPEGIPIIGGYRCWGDVENVIEGPFGDGGVC